MGYCGCMGYEAVFPANQLGGLKNVWNLREYGVCEPWVTRESTVVQFTELCMLQALKKMGILGYVKMTSKADMMCDITLTSLH